MRTIIYADICSWLFKFHKRIQIFANYNLKHKFNGRFDRYNSERASPIKNWSNEGEGVKYCNHIHLNNCRSGSLIYWDNHLRCHRLFKRLFNRFIWHNLHLQFSKVKINSVILIETLTWTRQSFYVLQVIGILTTRNLSLIAKDVKRVERVNRDSKIDAAGRVGVCCTRTSVREVSCPSINTLVHIEV